MNPSDHAHHPHHEQLINDDGSWKYTNKLIDETSPYLLQHAHNPVDWYPWHADTFESARAQDKPIFLSIGYATCYWCHVMERQVFEDPQIAAQMNEHFINIKVDREERPDIDDIYMAATTLLTRRGGWPMSTFVTPPSEKGQHSGGGLRPFYAGTYFPPEPQHGMPGFPQVIAGISNAWKTQREDVLEQAEKVSQAVRESLDADIEPAPVDPGLPGQAVGQLLQNFDPDHGGFGGAPKFPQPGNILFLLAATQRADEAGDELDHAITHTLDRMARGGMYDQIGGGFHRYSTDAQWLVPHFEKMLYDNGQLMECYARAARRWPEHEDAPLWRRVIKQTADYIAREMTDPEHGLFYAAQDAEVDAKEGGSFVWTPDQIDQALADKPALAELAKSLYGLDQGTNFRDPHDPSAQPVNVLYQPRPLPTFAEKQGIDMERAQELQREIDTSLRRARDQRKQPLTDDKVLAGWNGLMIAGLAASGRLLDEPGMVEAAARAGDCVWEQMSDFDEDGEVGLYRVMRGNALRVPALLEDYAMLARGTAELYRATDETRWLKRTRRLVDDAAQRFGAEAGAFYDVRPRQEDLFVRPRSTHDGAVFSGTSQMIHSLLDLVELGSSVDLPDLPSEDYARRAAEALQALSRVASRLGANAAHLQHALLRALSLIPQFLETDNSGAGPQPEASVRVSVRPDKLVLDGGSGGAILELDLPEDMHVLAPGEMGEGMHSISLSGGDAWSVSVDYPEPVQRDYPFADAPLAVYEGRVELPLRVMWEGDGPPPDELPLHLRLQLCHESACLPARDVELRLPVQSDHESGARS